MVKNVNYTRKWHNVKTLVFIIIFTYLVQKRNMDSGVDASSDASVLISGKYGECHSCDASCKTCFGPQALDCSSCFKGFKLSSFSHYSKLKASHFSVCTAEMFVCHRVFPGPGQFLCGAVSFRFLWKLCHLPV